MPIYDFKCKHEHYTEAIAGYDEKTIKCSRCGAEAHRIVSLTGVNCINEDAGWLKSVLEVVDKKSNRPWCKEFLKNPTRSNYKRWMRGEGIRPVEEGEWNRPIYAERQEKEREAKINDQIMKKRYERKRITVHG
jgi:putative FmdB family regulatory protein